jgi:hypothetical protein
MFVFSFGVVLSLDFCVLEDPAIVVFALHSLLSLYLDLVY